MRDSIALSKSVSLLLLLLFIADKDETDKRILDTDFE